MVREKGNSRLVEAHDAYWPSEAAMAEGNPQLIVEGGGAVVLPPAIVVQQDRFLEQFRGGGRKANHMAVGDENVRRAI